MLQYPYNGKSDQNPYTPVEKDLVCVVFLSSKHRARPRVKFPPSVWVKVGYWYLETPRADPLHSDYLLQFRTSRKRSLRLHWKIKEKPIHRCEGTKLERGSTKGLRDRTFFFSQRYPSHYIQSYELSTRYTPTLSMVHC